MSSPRSASAQRDKVVVCPPTFGMYGVAARIQGADVVSTDVWASMGQEADLEQRRQAFQGYTVTSALLELAAPGAIFLHCLPAHRGEEVEEGVLEGPKSRVWDEAENRLHVQKALLLKLVNG